MKEQKPRLGLGACAKASALQLSHHSCDDEATVELMTVRLNARVGTYRLDMCLCSRRVCLKGTTILRWPK
jgi:hypothetical protein